MHVISILTIKITITFLKTKTNKEHVLNKKPEQKTMESQEK